MFYIFILNIIEFIYTWPDVARFWEALQESYECMSNATFIIFKSGKDLVSRQLQYFTFQKPVSLNHSLAHSLIPTLTIKQQKNMSIAVGTTSFSQLRQTVHICLKEVHVTVSSLFRLLCQHLATVPTKQCGSCKQNALAYKQEASQLRGDCAAISRLMKLCCELVTF